MWIGNTTPEMRPKNNPPIIMRITCSPLLDEPIVSAIPATIPETNPTRNRNERHEIDLG